MLPGKISNVILKVMTQRFLFSILLLMLITQMIFATAQDPDVLIYNGKNYDLFSNPLEDFYAGNKNKRPNFWVEPNAVSSGNRRGYIAAWKIIDDKLYLTKIDSWFCDQRIKTKSGCRKVALRDLFGAKVIDGRVAATWFSGDLRVPDGKLLKYIHSGYASIYERDIIFNVDAGKIVKQETIANMKRELPSDQEIYQQELAGLKKKASEEKQGKPLSSNLEADEKSELVTITENGWGKVVVGADRKAVESVLGQGEHDGRKYDDVYFVEYLKKCIQISYTNKTDEAYAIFFYYKHSTYYGDCENAPVKTDKGITWNSSPEDVIKAYGKPPRDFSDDSGGKYWRRLEYDKIDFLFQGERMSRISISPEKCTGCEKQNVK